MPEDIAPIGHNNPPSPMEEIQARYDDAFIEADNWLDGTKVETEGQMKAVDALLASVKEAEKEAKVQKEAEFRPHKEAADAVTASWQPFLTDLGHKKKGLAAVVSDYKKKLADEKAAAERAARAEAEKLRREAEAKADEVTDIEVQREAQQMMQAAKAMARAAVEIKAEKPKGMRKVWKYEVTDYSAFMRWILANDKPALMAFADEYARTHHRDGVVRDGLKAWQDKEAF